MSLDESLTSRGLPLLDRRAWIEVDLDVLETNARILAGLVPPGGLGAVVKADGYGHGLEMAARAAVRGGAGWLCVAMMGEARRLRRDGYRGRVFVLYPVPEHELDFAAEHGIDVTVGGVGQARAIVERTRGLDQPLRVHVEIDTGMTRGGVRPEDAVTAATLVASAPGVDLAGVWSHLAAPEDPAVTRSQHQAYVHVLDALAGAGVHVPTRHLCASGGLLAPGAETFDLARVGLALYGEAPLPTGGLPVGVRPALTLKARSVRVAEVVAGTGVGYGGTWVAQRPSRIATLPLGYADGLSRVSSPGCSVLVRGRRAPMVGRVSSDATTVDVTDCGELSAADEFVLLGAQGEERITADEVAAVRSTISWEVLQSLGARLPRVYVTDGLPMAIRPTGAIEVAAASGGSLAPYG